MNERDDNTNTTTVHTSTDDQGGGGMGCDSCGYFGYMQYWCIGEKCPSCKRVVTNHAKIEPYPFGGSDF